MTNKASDSTSAMKRIRSAMNTWTGAQGAICDQADLQKLLDALDARTDASRLLAEKDAEIARLREALSDCLEDLEYLANAPDSAYARPDDETIAKARAALNP